MSKDFWQVMKSEPTPWAPPGNPMASGSPRYFIVPGIPVGKPRQTRRDKWLTPPRPCVARYRAWADLARKCAGKLPSRPRRLDVVAYFPVKGKGQKGDPHMVRPDADNLIKSCADALFPKNDATIYEMRVKKFWDDGHGPRVEIAVS